MANYAERIGVNHIGEIAERNQWIFWEQQIDDFGIDIHMELTEPTGKSKQLLALQMKSGASWFEEKKDDYVIFCEEVEQTNTITIERILKQFLDDYKDINITTISSGGRWYSKIIIGLEGVIFNGGFYSNKY